MNRRRRRALRPALDPLDDRCLPSGLTPSQVTHAYGLGGLTFGTRAANGSGQTIAIVDAYNDPNIRTELAVFDSASNLPAPPSLTVVGQTGTSALPSNDAGWAQEEALDVEWAHALAPGASIVLVEANSDRVPDLMAAVRTAAGLPGVSVVSMSWGGSESPSMTPYDGVFTTPAGHTGITFVAASGDEGARGGAEWPASSPNVLAVGGTTLSVNSTGTYLGESVWSGSSGGNSRYEPEPAYQRSVQSTGTRSTPDVSFDGNPNTGVEVYTIDPTTGRSSWEQVGGTSLGAQAWAAIIAIADEGRSFAGMGTLNGATQTMTALYSLPSSDFHTVSTTSTGSRFNSRFGSGVVASPGLGSPNGAALVNGLVAYRGGSTSTAATIGVRSADAVEAAHQEAHSGSTSTPASGTSGLRSSGGSSGARRSVVTGQTSASASSSILRDRAAFDTALRELATESLLNS